MTDDERGQFELSRRKVLGSMAIIGAAGAGAGAGTWAAWEDSETSEDNYVEAGDMELALHTGQSGSWILQVDGVAPGDSGEETGTLENVGDIEGELSAEVTDVGGANNDLAQDLEIRIPFTGVAAIGPHTADDLEGREVTGPVLSAGDTQEVRFEWEIADPPTGNGAGERVSFEVEFTLEHA
ncbi:SipW-dependent-type signal peptide-containing protein [Halobacteria archaeon AArc-curdl1]|uniref:SipW-dependent-type signal peptide-containing protein n=1 Tax=Natronosalvus hydrolyticus TaxID=2979988 RepID=A0AAP3E9P2_9EURY|nr:SipW-dependent-type signal peptide-containing protein [Halobacteria archaeon AArc-curdl1]